MEQQGLLNSDTDPRALTLQGRLMKDRAKLASGSKRPKLFGEAARLYAKAADIERGSYPLINAASLSLLAGQQGQSETLAREVLAALDSNPDEAETPYWLGATRAEALLLLGQETEARAALRSAVTKQPAAWEDHAATIGQFELLCIELDCEVTWLDQLRPPASMQFAGIMNVAQSSKTAQGEIADWLERENIGFGYGALAAGSDIWIAEALLARGGELHVVLPCDRKTFRDASVTAVDAAWGPRFDHLLEEAETVECLDYADMPDAAAVARGDTVAVGRSVQNAGQLRSSAKRLRLVGNDDAIPSEKAERVSIIKAPRLAPQLDQHSAHPSRPQAIILSEIGIVQFDSLRAAWQQIGESGRKCALDWVVIQSGEVPDELADRLSAMLECAEADQCVATQAAGYGLLGSGAKLRVETAGDMRWAGGLMPLYALF